MVMAVMLATATAAAAMASARRRQRARRGHSDGVADTRRCTPPNNHQYHQGDIIEMTKRVYGPRNNVTAITRGDSN